MKGVFTCFSTFVCLIDNTAIVYHILNVKPFIPSLILNFGTVSILYASLHLVERVIKGTKIVAEIKRM